jgi:hypothetical protein
MDVPDVENALAFAFYSIFGNARICSTYRSALPFKLANALFRAFSVVYRPDRRVARRLVSAPLQLTMSTFHGAIARDAGSHFFLR